MVSKAHKLADVQAGADSLGILLDAMEGPDRPTKGNGLIPTHYVPTFCERNGRQERAACGAWVGQTEFSLEPTCPVCQAYLAADAALGDDPF